MTDSRHQLLGCPIDALTLDETVDRILELIEAGTPSTQFSLNAAKVVSADRDSRLQDCLRRATIVSADGQSLVWAGQILGVPLPERVAGIDLFLALMSAFEIEGVRPYFLGARKPVIENAVAEIARRHPALEIAGFHHGHFDPTLDETVAQTIAQVSPSALFVGMSSPRKEEWIDTYQSATRAPFAMGVGGTFDVLAGVTRRAPDALQRIGLEWLYRLVQEPRRLAGRYARTNAAFVGLVAHDLLRRARRGN